MLESIETGQSWDVMEGDTLKWSIRKNYKDKKWRMGLTVGVVHPFSKGKYYDEPLADIDQIISAFEEAKFKLVQRGSFIDWLTKYETSTREKISADDKRYGTLYTYVSLVKI